MTKIPNDRPPVSIGVFVYNEEKHISRTIESWLAQDYQNTEIVISDNASEDQTFDIAQQYAEKDHRIILSRNPKNLGAAYNSKKVVEISSGKYFIWSSGHDDRDPKLISSCINVLEANQNIVLAYPQAIWINEKGESFDSIGGCIETRGLDPISRLNVALWGLDYASPVYGLFRAEALRKASLGKSMIAPDVLLLSELSILGEFAYIPQPLLKIRKMPDYGSWASYVNKVFNKPLSELSVPEVCWEMLKEFVTNITGHIEETDIKIKATYLIMQGLMAKYGGVLGSLLREKNSNLSEQEYNSLQKIQYISNLLQKNNEFLANDLIELIDDSKTKQYVKTLEVKLPVILIDGVFFQLYQTGIARVWKSLLEQWANTEFAHHILVLDRANTAPKINGIRYRTIHPYDYNNTDADKQMLQEICNEEEADLFISTYYTTPLNTPSVFMAYDMIPEVLDADLNQPMWVEKHQAINHAAGFIAISENTANDLNQCFPQIPIESVTVAHCGVDSLFSPASEAEIQSFKYKYGIHKPYFLLGGLGGYKNAILFFQAFSQLANKTGFDIVATGAASQLPSEWRQFTTGCTFHGLHLPDEELRLAYAGAVALVYPSKYEGFGMPVAEAMACGCPVITTPNASLPEVAGEAAIYVGDEDIEAMANALCDVQKPSLRQQLIAAGLQQASQFSWGKMAAIVQNVLLNAINAVSLGEINFLVFPDWQCSEQTLVTELGTVLKTLNRQLPVSNITLLVEASDIGPEAAELFVTDLLLGLTLEEGLTLNENLDIQYLNHLPSPQWTKMLPAILARFQLDCDDQEAIAESQAEDLTILRCSAPNYLMCPDWHQPLDLTAEALAAKLTAIATDSTISPGTLSIYAPAGTLDSAAETLLDIITSLALEQGLDLSATWTISIVSDLAAPQWSALLALMAAKLHLPHEDANILDVLNSHQWSSH